MKTLLSSALVLFAICTVSCKKNHTCQCNGTETYTYTYTEFDGTSKTETDTETWSSTLSIKDTKKKAEEKCTSYNTTTTSGSPTYGQYKSETNCTLK